MNQSTHRLSAWARLRRWLSWPLVLLLAAIIVFEELAWDELSAIVARLAKWPPLAVLERWVASRPPKIALALFILPALALLPVKLAALFLIEQGHAALGLLVILLAKLGGTALVARLFTLTQPSLMQVAWFVRWYRRFQDCRAWVFARLHDSVAWRWSSRLIRRVRARWARPSAWSRLVSRIARQWRGARRGDEEENGGAR
ncbi:hypothetical protein [Chromobacterium sp. IIBBL 290-4]|uniref:hypothetical protein n=1 Tax=Chromobacterium sp. IIBBL 290-4 TaxID=2953890 RepID=UPI0020B8B7D7|nr:hypothetical protein [Chromobacterium sp. IIBBL 290-4]UTH73935.1 hypothetical protein NKT35_20695 [Chromobacterium sp. IIBBL 290-4]